MRFATILDGIKYTFAFDVVGGMYGEVSFARSESSDLESKRYQPVRFFLSTKIDKWI